MRNTPRSARLGVVVTMFGHAVAEAACRLEVAVLGIACFESCCQPMPCRVSGALLLKGAGDQQIIQGQQCHREFDCHLHRVDQKEWGIQKTEAIFTANSLHIMSEKSVENLIFEASQKLSSDGQLIVYGPFKYEQRFTSVSNADFDSRLRDKSDYSAIRDFEWINSLCKSKGLLLKKDFTMPANNRLLLFKKI